MHTTGLNVLNEFAQTISLEVPSMSQLPDNSKPLQTRISQPTVLLSYPESDYHWLVVVLDKLIEFMRRDENRGVPELIENDYDWAHELLIELVDAVGESDTHPLRPLMEFVWQLIANYEDKYVPKLTELFPELAKEGTTEVTSRNRQHHENTPKLSDSELAAHGFFSIGCLLWEGGKAEKALAAYDTAIRLQPDYAEVYNNRGNIKSGLGSHDAALEDYDEAIRLNPNFMNAYINRGIVQLGLNNTDEARADLQRALELAEQQGQIDLKALIEELFQEPNMAEAEIILDTNGESGANEAVPKQQNKESRRGGQWKGKVKIAEDFDELPESFMVSFREEND